MLTDESPEVQKHTHNKEIDVITVTSNTYLKEASGRLLSVNYLNCSSAVGHNHNSTGNQQIPSKIDAKRNCAKDMQCGQSFLLSGI